SDLGMGNTYQPSMNAAYGISPSSPLVVAPGSSLISTRSDPVSDALPQLEDAAILTVLSTTPEEGSFRPAYVGTDKSIRYSKDDLDYLKLPNLAPVVGAPSLATVSDYFERPWLDHIPGWQARFMHPSNNMPDYGREIALQIGTGALALLVDNATPDK